MEKISHSANIQNEKLLFENLKEARYLSSSDLARFLGVSIHTIRAWRKFRMITPTKFGRSVRWLLRDVLEELAKRSH